MIIFKRLCLFCPIAILFLTCAIPQEPHQFKSQKPDLRIIIYKPFCDKILVRLDCVRMLFADLTKGIEYAWSKYLLLDVINLGNERNNVAELLRISAYDLTQNLRR